MIRFPIYCPYCYPMTEMTEKFDRTGITYKCNSRGNSNHPSTGMPFQKLNLVITAPDKPLRSRIIKPTEEMINRFLQWKLPENFRPDAGISYKKPPEHCPTPSGTNLLDYMQAKEMLEFVLETTPDKEWEV